MAVPVEAQPPAEAPVEEVAPEPVEEQEALRNASVRDELRRGRQEKAKAAEAPAEKSSALLVAAAKLGEYAQQVAGEREEARAELEETRSDLEAAEVVRWASEALDDADFGEPGPELAQAADELLNTIGPADPRLEEFVARWQLLDPEAAVAWVTDTAWEIDQQERQAQATFDEQLAAMQTEFAERWQAGMTKAVEAFAKRHPDMPRRYVDEMVKLALESGVDLVSDPEHLEAKLGPLYEAVFQQDPDAVPVQMRDRTWRTSPSWEANEQAKMMRLMPQPKNQAERALLEERLALQGGKFVLDSAGRIVPAKVEFDIDQIGRNSLPQSPAQWEAAEQDRLSAAWGLPRAKGGRHLANAKKADAGPKPDPYWSYVGTFQKG